MKINNLKIKLFILIFVSTSHNFIMGQNLVPNHSFETITVGNFYDDVNTSIGVIDPELISQSLAYYYIDDISVTHLTLSNDSTWHCYQSAGCQWAGSNPSNPGQFASLSDCQASCTPASIDTIDGTNNKILIKVVDILGRETSINSNEILFFIYENGTVERKIIIE